MFSIFFMWQILMGDATHEHFYAYKGRDPQARESKQLATTMILYFLYVTASFYIMILLLNMIIAIMGNAQAQRTELGRRVIYRHQLEQIVRFIYRFDNDVRLKAWSSKPTEDDNSCLQIMRKYWLKLLGDESKPTDNRVLMHKMKFPRYLTVAYRRSVEPESELDSMNAKLDFLLSGAANQQQMKLDMYKLEQ